MVAVVSFYADKNDLLPRPVLLWKNLNQNFYVLKPQALRNKGWRKYNTHTHTQASNSVLSGEVRSTTAPLCTGQTSVQPGETIINVQQWAYSSANEGAVRRQRQLRAAHTLAALSPRGAGTLTHGFSSTTSRA